MSRTKTFKHYFPYLKAHPTEINFDNAATSYICEDALNEINNYYLNLAANPHSLGLHALKVTNEMESSREDIAVILGTTKQQIFFNHGATCAFSKICELLKANFPNQKIKVLNFSDDHSSLYGPWISSTSLKQTTLITADSELLKDVSKITTYLKDESFDVICVTESSNIFGTVVSPQVMKLLKNAAKIALICDATQSVSHFKSNGFEIADFTVFSGHKIYGPTGIGITCMDQKWINKLDGVFPGGGNINSYINEHLDSKKTTKLFEPGTNDLANIAALAKAIKFCKDNAWSNNELQVENLKKFVQRLSRDFSIAQSDFKIPIIAISHQTINAQDLMFYLGKKNIRTRAGMSCATLSNKKTKNGWLRISLAIYNDKRELDYVLETLNNITIEKIVGELL